MIILKFLSTYCTMYSKKKSDNISSYQYRYGYFFILVLPFCFINFETLLLDV